MADYEPFSSHIQHCHLEQNSASQTTKSPSTRAEKICEGSVNVDDCDHEYIYYQCILHITKKSMISDFEMILRMQELCGCWFFIIKYPLCNNY